MIDPARELPEFTEARNRLRKFIQQAGQWMSSGRPTVTLSIEDVFHLQDACAKLLTQRQLLRSSSPVQERVIEQEREKTSSAALTAGDAERALVPAPEQDDLDEGPSVIGARPSAPPTAVDWFDVALDGASKALPVLAAMLKAANLKQGLVVADQISADIKCALKVYREQRHLFVAAVECAPVPVSDSERVTPERSAIDNSIKPDALLSPRSIPADGVEEAKKQIARILVQSEKPVCLSFTEDMSDPGYCKRCDYAEYCHDERDEAWKVIDAINEQQQARIAELEAQVDAFQQAERIDSLTDEELLAEMRARGEDTDQIAADTRALLNRTLEAFKAKQALLACQPPRHADNCASRFCECGEEGYVNKEDECDGHRRQPCDCGLGQPPHAQERKRHDPSDTPTS